jgi:hypothetical protein
MRRMGQQGAEPVNDYLRITDMFPIGSRVKIVTGTADNVHGEVIVFTQGGVYIKQDVLTTTQERREWRNAFLPWTGIVGLFDEAVTSQHGGPRVEPPDSEFMRES